MKENIKLAAVVAVLIVGWQIAEMVWAAVAPKIAEVIYYAFGGLMLLVPVGIAFDWYQERKKGRDE